MKKAFTLAEGAAHAARSHNIRRVAFTLAEVLITLGIIGVVAAITIPNLVGRWRERVTVNKVTHAYSLLSQAYLKMLQKNGDPRNISCNNTDCFLNLLAEELKVISPIDLAMIPEIFNLSGDIYLSAGYYNYIYRMILENGYIIYSRSNFSDKCDFTYSNWDGVDEAYKTICMTIMVDINGESAPNTLGRDIFSFYLTHDRVIPFGLPDEPYYRFESRCKKDGASTWDGSNNGEYCAGWVLVNKNMDYLHCSDLSWKGKKKCK